MRHTYIMIYIDWSENGLLILLFQDNNGIYSLVMTLKAYNSNNRKKVLLKFVTKFNLMVSKSNEATCSQILEFISIAAYTIPKIHKV